MHCTMASDHLAMPTAATSWRNQGPENPSFSVARAILSRNHGLPAVFHQLVPLNAARGLGSLPAASEDKQHKIPASGVFWPAVEAYLSEFLHGCVTYRLLLCTSSGSTECFRGWCSTARIAKWPHIRHSRTGNS